MIKRILLFFLAILLVLTMIPMNVMVENVSAASAYYVAFNGNGATSGSMSKQTVYVGVSQSLSKNQFKKTNSTFQGWNTKADGSGSFFSDGQSVKNLTSAGNTVTLYAQWKNGSSGGGTQPVGNVVVKFDGNNATSGSMSQQTLTNGEGKLNKNRFTKTNASFLGWSTNRNATKPTYYDGEYVTLKSSTTLYAVWSVMNDVTITFSSNGASGNDYTQTMKANTLTYLISNKFSRSGYAFQGWSNKVDGNVIYKDGQKASFSSNVKLYAIWKKSSVGNITITFNGNGATSGSGSTQTLVDGEGKLGKNLFSRTGYEFLGWSTVKTATQPTYLDGEYVKFSSNTTLYAVWKKASSSTVVPKPVSVIITFNSNNGSGVTSKQTLTNGEGKLGKCLFTRTGYTFQGWSVNKAATQKTYADGAYVKFSSNVILYAVWTKNSKVKQATKKSQKINTSFDSYQFADIGKTKNIKAKASSKLKCTYKSADSKIVSVDKNGKLTAKKAGTTKITITQKGNSKYKSVTKTVKVSVPKIRGNRKALQPWYDAMETQYHWSYNSVYSWGSDRQTVGTSRTHGTCITFPSVSAQRCKVIKSGGYITGTTGKGQYRIEASKRSFRSINSKYWYYRTFTGKTVKQMVKSGEIIPGDIIGASDHTFVYAGKSDNGILLYNEAGRVRGNKHSNRGILNHPNYENDAKKVILLARIKTFDVKSSCENGTITYSDKYMAGQTAKVVYKANKGKKLKSIIVDGKKISIKKYKKSYTFKKLDKNHTIKVVFG